MRVIRSVVVQYAGRIVGLAISLLSLGLLTRYLGVSAYGEYATAMALAGAIVLLADFGFFWSTIQHLNDREDRLRVLREISSLKFLLTAFLLVVGFLFVRFGDYSAVVYQAYLLLTIFVLASSLNNVLVALYQTEYKMGWPTLVDVIARLFGLVLIGVGVWLKLEVPWFILGVVVTATLNIALNWAGLRSIVGSVTLGFRHIRWSEYYGSVLLIGFIYSFSVLYSRIDIVLLSRLKPSVDVGIYGLATKFVELIQLVNSLFISALFPLLVASYSRDRQKFFEYMNRSLLVLAVVGLAIPTYGLWFTSEAVRLVGGSEYVVASAISFGDRAIGAPMTLGVLLIFISLVYLSASFTIGLLAAKRLRWLLLVNVGAAVLNVGLNLWLIPSYSYLASAGIAVVTQFLVMTFTGYYFCRTLSFTLPWRQLGKIMVALLPGLIFLALVPQGYFLVRLVVAILLYALMLGWLLPELRRIFSAVFSRSPKLHS